MMKDAFKALWTLVAIITWAVVLICGVIYFFVNI